jgi:tetratricopeptide (TPR) repeat protein
MNAEEFQELRTAFERLLDTPEAERDALLEQYPPQRCAELRRMLAAREGGSSILDRSLAALIGVQPAAPTQIGPYSIERQLGMGGMGVVYLAVRSDGAFQRQAAIKILRHDRIAGHFLTRFRQERRILAQLNHPHIASILDAGETPGGDPYFVMEYVEGVPITEFATTHALSTERRLDLFLQVCDAIQYAHRNLTVHRDLKPGNVLVTEAAAVKLLDFGIAKLLEEQPEAAGDMPRSAVILTPDYSSPEQIRKEPITTGTDVFSLGILLYELLTGAHPFRRKGRLPHEVMGAICEDDPPALNLDKDLQAIILTSLRKDPAWRYPSVEQLAEDIRRYRSGLPILARGNRRWYRLGKFVRRQRLPLAAAALLLLSLTAGIVATGYQARRADREREVAQSERARAETERSAAQRQREAAVQAQQVAVEQRRVAELRTREAETERRKEEQRYREVRSLASSLLFDLYDGVRDLAGSATARRLIVAKAQHQLEMLAADRGHDIALTRDLAASYERMGELQMVSRRPNKADAAAALDSYRRAVDLRQKISREPEALPRDRRDLALSLAKLGDGTFWAGDAKGAVAPYDTAWSMAKALVMAPARDSSMPIALATIDERRCIVLMAGGNTKGALEACREGIATLAPLAADSPDDVKIQRLLAGAQASYANDLRLSNQPHDAEKQARQALESLDRLQRLAPSNAEYRRMASSTETVLAQSLTAAGDAAGSLQAFRQAVQAMQVAIEIDPGDLGSALRLGVTLLAFSRRLASSGSAEEAHDAAQDALRLLDRTAAQPGAGPLEWNEFADALLKVDWPDLRRWPKALELARKSVAATGRKNPFFLDTLAWAYFRTGNANQAAETEREAIGLLPVDSKGGLRDELQRGLTTFQAAK